MSGVKQKSSSCFLLFILPMCLFVLCSGCTVRVITTHEPMHPQNNEQVTFKAEATGEVDRVLLEYRRCALADDASGNPTQTCPSNWTTAHTCDPASTESLVNCEYTLTGGFPANSLIEFKATAYSPDGHSSSETYSFAAGTYPWPDDPIPIRVKGDTANRLDVIFIPDTDITLANFRSLLDEVVEDLYFKYNVTFRFWRGLYNFYYSGQQGNYEELCNFTSPPNMANLSAVGDTIAILHQTNLRDCRSGNLMSSEIDYDKTLIHESGHALFDLRDEYCCDSSYSQQPCVPNIWSSLAGCQSDASNISHPASNCTQICSGTDCINFWRIDPTAPIGCIMGPSQHAANSDFGKACLRRINWRYGKCISGDCFTIPDCP